MTKFLQEVARQILLDHPDNMDNVAVVFNNRRPSLFLRKELIHLNRDKEAFLLPRTMGFDDLVNDMSDWQLIPSEFLLFDLFDIHRNLSHSDESFEDFISFGETMLHDFAEIDLYHVDAGKLFDNLGELKAIGEWDVSSPTPDAASQRYLLFYKSLYRYYTTLRERLAAQHKAYRGMAYREVADHIEELSSSLSYTRIYFVGFSVLSTCERAIIEHFVKKGTGVCIADGDSYYVDNPEQEAGDFLRQLQDLLPASFSYPSHFTTTEKHIHLVNCPENLLQVKYTGTLLDQMLHHDVRATEDTCVVLADEHLLIPMLNSLPEVIERVNVTMGLPFTQAGAYTLTLRLLQLYTKMQGDKFYHRELFEFFSDYNIDLLLGGHNRASDILRYLAANKLVFVSVEQITTMCNTLHISLAPIAFLFRTDGTGDVPHSGTDPDLFLSRCKQLLTLLLQHRHEQHNIPECEALTCSLSILDHLASLQQTYSYITSLSSLERIYTRLAQRHKIAFYGEPLQGLQMLGVLETRCLDFDRIIILSVNESTIPSGKSNSSLIPYTLRRAFGIPTYAERDAIFAYHFYHILQRATDITLLYHTETEAAGKGEPSRFITQLIAELAAQHDNIHIDTHFVSPSTAPTPLRNNTEVAKNDGIMHQLQQQAAYGFSPSALNLYLRCPLQFHYSYMLHVKEVLNVDEDLQASELGTLVHDILEHLYTTSADGCIHADTLEQSLSNIEQLVEQTFAERYQQGRATEGRNYYYRAIAKTQIANLLNSEIAQLKQGNTLQIITLEEPLRSPLSFTLHDEPLTVWFRGTADRIDRWNGQLRIIDYKTGKVADKDLCFKHDLSDYCEGLYSIPDKWLQVMTYAWMYYRQHPDERLTSGIYPLSNSRVELLPAQWYETKLFDSSLLEYFQTLLQQIMSNLMDRDRPFAATPGDSCRLCPFRSLCSVAK